MFSSPLHILPSATSAKAEVANASPRRKDYLHLFALQVHTGCFGTLCVWYTVCELHAPSILPSGCAAARGPPRAAGALAPPPDANGAPVRAAGRRKRVELAGREQSYRILFFRGCFQEPLNTKCVEL